MTERAPQICPRTGAYLRPHFESLPALAVAEAACVQARQAGRDHVVAR